MLKLGILKLSDADVVQGFVEFGVYGSGAIAMIIRDKNTPDSECICKPTVSLDQYGRDDFLEPDECYLKTWSENAGIFEQLVRNGFVTHVERNDFIVSHGNVARCVKLSAEAYEEFRRQGREGN